MKVNAVIALPAALMIAFAAAITPSPVPMISTIPFLISRKRFLLLELSVIALSAFALSELDRFSLFAYTERTATFVNLYLLASDYVDRPSILAITGKAGLPLIVGLNYFPLFLSVSSEVTFYARIRGITNELKKGKLVSFFQSLALPILVEVVRVAENLNMAYSLKVYGGGVIKRKLRVTGADALFGAYGALVLWLSLIPHF
ncbi:MAG: hypothetical protein ACP5T2_01520 [Thermoprotei archaeon]